MLVFRLFFGFGKIRFQGRWYTDADYLKGFYAWYGSCLTCDVSLHAPSLSFDAILGPTVVYIADMFILM